MLENNPIATIVWFSWLVKQEICADPTLFEAFAMLRWLQIARNQKIQNLCFAAINLVIMDCKDIMQLLVDNQLKSKLNNEAYS